MVTARPVPGGRSMTQAALAPRPPCLGPQPRAPHVEAGGALPVAQQHFHGVPAVGPVFDVRREGELSRDHLGRRQHAGLGARGGAADVEPTAVGRAAGA